MPLLHEDRVVKPELYEARKQYYWTDYKFAVDRGLMPTAYFFEFCAYHDRSRLLQDRNMGEPD